MRCKKITVRNWADTFSLIGLGLISIAIASGNAIVANMLIESSLLGFPCFLSFVVFGVLGLCLFVWSVTECKEEVNVVLCNKGRDE